ncbi:MAG: chemotaxis protein CheA [Gemmatimonadaceae bacterium]|nr:chemotaxis protein CheA [Gemmatimonadaceae bacterium]
MIPAALNDAAFIIMQLEPSELEDIKALRDTLRHFAVFDAEASPQVRAHAQQAATQLNLILLGAGDEPAALLASASQAIAAAVKAAEEAGRGAVRATLTDLVAIVRDESDVEALAEAMDAGVPPAPTPVPARPTDRAAVAVAPAPAPVTPVPHVPAARDGGTIPDDADLSLLADFIAESRESMTGAEAALLALEANPADSEAVNTVFRAFHTVKGTAAFMGLDRLAEFAHHAESLLSRVRDRELDYTQPVADLSLRSNDVLGEFLDAVEKSVQTHEVITLPSDYAALMHDLLHVDAMLAGVAPAAPAPASPAAAVTRAAVTTAPVGRVVEPSARTVARADSDLSVRVRTDRLDRLIDMVGELVIAQSMIAADPAVTAVGQHDLVKKVSHAGKIMRELQDLSMSMRMVPLKPTFQKLTRLVRDVALKAGKVVEFITDGEETELDRNMVDAIADPLVHMVRNAVDHGVEGPADRERSGKPRAGRVTLSAFQQGGSVIVELRDDGRGLNRDRILAKAIEKGLVSPSQSLTDSEINALIFAAGFSTAEQLTDISGRGVGMDVVRRNIESIRGRIDIQSVLGRGTTFQIRLPLTLAVTDGMLVRVGDERYIVPLTSIALSFRPEREMMSTIPPHGEVVMLRGEVMPVVRLHQLFGIPGAVRDPSAAILMIVGEGEHRVALLVDQLLGQQQVVAKALGDGVGEIPGISGGAILSDGRVGLIIDVARMSALVRSGDPRPRGVPVAA